MKRSQFIATTAIASVSALSGFKREQTGETDAGIKKIGGITLEETRKKYWRELIDEYIPFWIKYGTDHKYGGVMHGLDHDGTIVHSNKYHWFQGRHIWLFSYLYNHFEQESQYLEIAQKTKDFMLEHFPEEPEGILWARKVTREGKVLESSKATDPFGCYFGIEGMFELAYAKQDEELRDQALDLYQRLSKFIHSDAVDYEAFNTYMADLEIGTQFLRYWDNSEVEAITARAVDIIMNKFYNPEIRMYNAELHNDFSRIEDQRNLYNPGHGVEVMWMVMHEAIRTKDQSLYDLAAQRMMRHLVAGWDFINSGIVTAVRVGQGCYDWGSTQPVGMDVEFTQVGEYHYMKSLWSIAEALVGTFNLYARTGSERACYYNELCQKCADEKFSLEPHGYPLHMVYADREITFRPHTARKGNYHYPRMLMLTIKEIDRLIANDGHPIGLQEETKST